VLDALIIGSFGVWNMSTAVAIDRSGYSHGSVFQVILVLEAVQSSRVTQL
jgi:hypothetical protein